MPEPEASSSPEKRGVWKLLLAVIVLAGVFELGRWWIQRRAQRDTPLGGLPTAGVPWRNSLGMEFAPVVGVDVLVSVYETRVREFRQFVDETRAEWPGPDLETSSEHPAVNVTWDDAAAFCEWLTQRELRSRLLNARQRYRLPTDAEWSAAAGAVEDSRGTPAEKSAGEILQYVWGSRWPPPAHSGNFAGEEAPVDKSEIGTFIAGYNDGYPRLAPVGQFTANRFGLRDLAGNALEWCEDWFSPSRQGRVMRGGSWLNGDAVTLSATHRAEIPPHAGLDVTGFRCVLDLGLD